jgi:hypothetical protein
MAIVNALGIGGDGTCELNVQNFVLLMQKIWMFSQCGKIYA